MRGEHQRIVRKKCSTCVDLARLLIALNCNANIRSYHVPSNLYYKKLYHVQR
jgi:hypothetical protein